MLSPAKKNDMPTNWYMASNTIKAGSKVVMTHAQRQAFLKTSPLGQLFGVAHLLPEVEDSKSHNHALIQREQGTGKREQQKLMFKNMRLK